MIIKRTYCLSINVFITSLSWREQSLSFCWLLVLLQCDVLWLSHIELANVLISQTNESSEAVNVKNLLWNSTSRNSTSKLNSCSKRFSSIYLDFNSVTVISNHSNKYDTDVEPTHSFVKSFEINSSTKSEIVYLFTTHMNSLLSTRSSQIRLWSLTSSASLASYSSSIQQSNNSLWTTDDLRSTTNVSSTSFSEMALTRRIWKNENKLIVIIFFFVENILYR